MPTVLSHPAVPIALACGVGERHVSNSLALVGVAASVIPDLDVIGFRMGVPYGSLFGHRGFLHSLFFAALFAAAVTMFSKKIGKRPLSVFAFTFLSIASHGLLDAATDGGLGVAFFSPFSNFRYFFPWRPIAVSPLTATRFPAKFTTLMLSELRWVWLPFLCAGGFGYAVRKIRGKVPSLTFDF